MFCRLTASSIPIALFLTQTKSHFYSHFLKWHDNTLTVSEVNAGAAAAAAVCTSRWCAEEGTAWVPGTLWSSTAFHRSHGPSPTRRTQDREGPMKNSRATNSTVNPPYLWILHWRLRLLGNIHMWREHHYWQCPVVIHGHAQSDTLWLLRRCSQLRWTRACSAILLQHPCCKQVSLPWCL